MGFQILKKEDQSLALEVPGDLLQRLTSPSSSKNKASLKESQGTVGELEEKLAKAEGKTMADFTPVEKANFVIVNKT